MEVEVHRWILSIWLELRYDRSSAAYWTIPLGTETVCAILRTWVTIWDTAHLFVAKPHLFLAYDQHSSALESPGHILVYPINHCIFPNASWQYRRYRQYSVLGSQYETQAHLFVRKPQNLVGYHSSLGILRICIPGSQLSRHGSGMNRSPADFGAVYSVAYNSSSDTTKIFNPVQNEVLVFVWNQLWQPSTDYRCMVPAQAHLTSETYASEAHAPQSTVHIISQFATFSSCFHDLWIGGHCAHTLASIKRLHI